MSSARAFQELDVEFTPGPTSTLDQDARPLLKRDMVAGLEKGLAVIEVFGTDRPRLTISEVAQAAGLTRAAARRYLLTLTHLGLVCQDRKMFMLTPRVLRLGQSYLQSATLPRLVSAELHRVADALKEGCSVSTLDGDEVVCVAASSAGHLPSLGQRPGERLPAHCSPQGRVLIAGLGPSAMEAWLSRHPALPALTPHTITDPERLRIELARVRLQGHAGLDQELETGWVALAVPLRNHRGETVAAFSVQAPSSRFTLEGLLTEALPLLRQAQSHLSLLL